MVSMEAGPPLLLPLPGFVFVILRPPDDFAIVRTKGGSAPCCAAFFLMTCCWLGKLIGIELFRNSSFLDSTERFFLMWLRRTLEPLVLVAEDRLVVWLCCCTLVALIIASLLTDFVVVPFSFSELKVDTFWAD